MNTGDYKAVTAGVKGGEKLVLGFIAMYAEENKKVDSHALAEDTGFSIKQIVRLTLKLKEAGRVQIEGGIGRAPYVYSLASANGDKMSAQASEDKTSELDIKSSQQIGSEDKLSPLADAGTKSPDKEIGSQDKKSGTPVAPSKAETITQQNEEANASSARGAGGSAKQSFIGRLLQFREAHLGTKLPAHKTEAAAAKWLFEQGWAFDDVTACHDFMVRQGRTWRGSAVTLNVVMSVIAEWKKGNLSDGKRTQPQANGKPSRAETVRGRDYSWAGDEPADGGGDVGADSRPLPGVKRLAGQVGR